jgi:hypothetical protein
MTTLVRKASTGEQGNAGEFGHHYRPDSAVTLQRRDQPADRTDIDRYFDGGVDDIIEAPWVAAGVFPTYDPGYWSMLLPTVVEAAGMKRTQKRILAKHLARAAAGAEPQGGDLPWVVRFEGEDYVIDGHHHVANAVHNRHGMISVKVFHLSVLDDDLDG